MPQAGGLPDVLNLLLSYAKSLPNLDEVVSTHGQTLGEKYASTLVECLSSSKSETRSAASALVRACVENEVVAVETIRKAATRLKPAKQRTVAALVADLTQIGATGKAGKENDTTHAAPAAKDEGNSSAGSMTQQGPTQTVPKALRVSASVPDSPSSAAAIANAEIRHPLLARGSASAPHRSHRPLVWPEYPEEPNGAMILGNLKKSWAAILPPTSVTALFPNSGIKKQDDGLSGCSLLGRALRVDIEQDGSVVQEQLELIQKWIAFVLCSKETTVGLQALLSLVNELYAFLAGSKRNLTESEASVLAPFLIEKASNAKVSCLRESFSWHAP